MFAVARSVSAWARGRILTRPLVGNPVDDEVTAVAGPLVVIGVGVNLVVVEVAAAATAALLRDDGDDDVGIDCGTLMLTT